MLRKLWRLVFGSPCRCAYEVEVDGSRVRYEAGSPAELLALVSDLRPETRWEPRPGGS